MMTVDGLPPLLSATMLLGVTCKEGLCTLSELAAQTVQLELLACYDQQHSCRQQGWQT